jgi:PAS domain S-box-containing protein
MKQPSTNFRKNHRCFRRVLLVGVLLLPLVLADRGFALDPARALLEYNCQTWSRQNGLPANGINAIVQSKDGYLWLGTTVGLARFDGIEFKLLDLARTPQVLNGIVTSLANANDGGLWVGLRKNAFGYFDGQSFSFRGKDASGKVNLDVRTILESKDGTVWLAAESEAARLTRAGSFEDVLGSSSNLVAYDILCSYEDSKGRIWFGTANSGVYYWEAGKITKLPDPDLDKFPVYCVTEDLKGKIWLGTGNGLCCYNSNLEKQDVPYVPWEIHALLVDRHDILWIGTSGQGLARYRNGQFESLRKTDGLTGDYVQTLAEDREGSLWIGTRDGLTQLTDVKFPTHHAAEDPTVKDALAVCASSKGGIWVGSSAGFTYFDGKPKTYGVDAGLKDTYTKRVFEARNGDVYLVSGKNTLAVFSGGKVVATYPAPDMVVGMAEDDQGVVVSVGGFLYRAGTNYFTPYVFTNAQPTFEWILNMATDRDGAIWVACQTGIFRVKDGGFQQWKMAAPLSTIMQWVCVDSDGVVWAAQLEGIVRLKDNQLRYIGRKDGLFDNNIYSLVPDDLGNFWVDSGRGIFQVSRKSMNDFADGKTSQVECVAYDGPESVKPADKTTQEHIACKTPDGRIWFPSANGVVEIDPAHISINKIAPPVHIDSIRANGIELARSKNIIVPPSHGELEFHFAALNFIAPQRVRFRYELEGYDKDWVETQDRRIAFYTNLKPGRYTFRVIAANADGVWNEVGDTINIELRPFYYQTAWFRLLCIGLALAVLVGIFLQRMRHLQLKQQALKKSRDLLEAEVRKRTGELAELQSLYHSLVDQMPAGVFRKDAEGRYVFVNDWYCRNKKMEPEQILGRTAAELAAGALQNPKAKWRPEMAIQGSTHHELIMRTGQIIEVEEQSSDAHGRAQHLRVVKSPVFDADGKIVGTQGMLFDITARKQAEAQLSYERDLLSSLLDSSPDQIYFKDLQSRFIKNSKAQAATFGVKSTDEMLGKTDFDFFTEAHARPAFEDEQKIIRTGVPLIGMVEKEIWKDGRTTWVLTSKMPLRNKDGQIIGTFGISKDITAMKEAEIRLEQVNKQLLETARLAGMAEIATNVLHNVGNVLNSVNVSASLVVDSVKKSKAASLAKVVAMFQEHEHDLGTFITSDPRGKQLPAYLAQLSEHLLADQKATVKELDLLVNNIAHIKEIVTMQQAYAKVSGVKEIVNLRELAEDSLRMNVGALGQHGVEVVREFEDVPPVNVDRHKVLQILVNLIRNAKHACQDSERADKKLTVRVANGEGRIKISVGDNGVGISPENLTRIFNHGFTTRKDGHGFGLHSGALAATEMGGVLTAHSDGIGQGATFILELPAPPKSSPA